MNKTTTHVFVVEDDQSYIQLLKISLEKHSGIYRFTMDYRTTLEEAVQALQNESKYDIILTDLGLPDSDGLDTLKKLQEAAAKTPVIVLSGYDDPELEMRAIHCGAQDYLVKGEVEKNVLIRSINYAIERKHIEEELKQAQEKYRSIYENTQEGIFQTTLDGKYLSANTSLARIYGYNSTGELISTLTDIGGKLYVKPGRREEFVRLMRWNQVVTNFESQIYRKDGKVIWISENVRAVRNDQGDFQYYEGTVEDITERKEAENRLRDSESLYHSLVETLPQNIFRKDLMERFTFANQNFCELLDAPLEEITGKTDFDFFPPELAQKYQNDDRKVMETGDSFETVEGYRTAEGKDRYVNVVKTPLYDAEGKIIGLQGIFWDITERILAEQREKQAREELARSQAELQRKNSELEKDMAMAREIQLSFFSQQYPMFPADVAPQKSAIQFYHRFIPAGTVSGDFLNVLRISDTQAGLFICDVMGHGVRSALVTAMLRAMLEELMPLAGDPGKLLTQMNHDLREILRQSGSLMFTTAVFMVVDLESKEIRFTNAGHPKPLLVRPEKGLIHHIESGQGKSQPALGLFEDIQYQTNQITVESGDMVFLYTDGLIEIENAEGEWFSQASLESTIQANMNDRLPDLCDQVLNEVKKFSGAAEFEDDVCLLGARIS